MKTVTFLSPLIPIFSFLIIILKTLYCSVQQSDHDERIFSKRTNQLAQMFYWDFKKQYLNMQTDCQCFVSGRLIMLERRGELGVYNKTKILIITSVPSLPFLLVCAVLLLALVVGFLRDTLYLSH